LFAFQKEVKERMEESKKGEREGGRRERE